MQKRYKLSLLKRPVDTWTPQDVSDWLSLPPAKGGAGLPKLAKRLGINRIDGLLLLQLTPRQIASQLNIEDVHEQEMLQKAIENLISLPSSGREGQYPWDPKIFKRVPKPTTKDEEWKLSYGRHKGRVRQARGEQPLIGHPTPSKAQMLLAEAAHRAGSPTLSSQYLQQPNQPRVKHSQEHFQSIRDDAMEHGSYKQRSAALSQYGTYLERQAAESSHTSFSFSNQASAARPTPALRQERQRYYSEKQRLDFRQRNEDPDWQAILQEERKISDTQELTSQLKTLADLQNQLKAAQQHERILHRGGIVPQRAEMDRVHIQSGHTTVGPAESTYLSSSDHGPTHSSAKHMPSQHGPSLYRLNDLDDQDQLRSMLSLLTLEATKAAVVDAVMKTSGENAIREIREQGSENQLAHHRHTDETHRVRFLEEEKQQTHADRAKISEEKRSSINPSGKRSPIRRHQTNASERPFVGVYPLAAVTEASFRGPYSRASNPRPLPDVHRTADMEHVKKVLRPLSANAPQHTLKSLLAEDYQRHKYELKARPPLLATSKVLLNSPVLAAAEVSIRDASNMPVAEDILLKSLEPHEERPILSVVPRAVSAPPLRLAPPITISSAHPRLRSSSLPRQHRSSDPGTEQHNMGSSGNDISMMARGEEAAKQLPSWLTPTGAWSRQKIEHMSRKVTSTLSAAAGSGPPLYQYHPAKRELEWVAARPPWNATPDQPYLISGAKRFGVGGGIFTKEMAERRALAHTASVRGTTRLHAACARGDAGMVVELLTSRKAGKSEELDVNARNAAGETPLHKAAAAPPRGGTDPDVCLTHLIRAGAEVDAVDTLGISPLMAAITRTGMHCSHALSKVEALLKEGADPNIADAYGETAVHKALIYNACSSPCTTPGKHPPSILNTLLRYGGNPNVVDLRGRTPLHHAACMWHRHAPDVPRGCPLPILLHAGAVVNAADIDGRTPLHSALLEAAEAACLHTVHSTVNHAKHTHTLFRGGEDPRVAAKAAEAHKMQDRRQQRPVKKLASKPIKWVVEVLLNAGANVHICDNAGVTPLHLAVRVGSVGLVQLLLGAGAPTQAMQADGRTPLMIAQRVGDTGIIRLLTALEPATTYPHSSHMAQHSSTPLRGIENENVDSLSQHSGTSHQQTSLLLQESGYIFPDNSVHELSNSQQYGGIPTYSADSEGVDRQYQEPNNSQHLRIPIQESGNPYAENPVFYEDSVSRQYAGSPFNGSEYGPQDHQDQEVIYSEQRMRVPIDEDGYVVTEDSYEGVVDGTMEEPVESAFAWESISLSQQPVSSQMTGARDGMQGAYRVDARPSTGRTAEADPSLVGFSFPSFLGAPQQASASLEDPTSSHHFSFAAANQPS